jgi:hypothetical protein
MTRNVLSLGNIVAASMDQLESADILRTFMSAYGEAWNTNDVEAIMNAYATPCFVVKGGHVLRHNDEAAKRQYFAELLASNNQQGPHAWSIGDLKPRQLGSDAASSPFAGSPGGPINHFCGISSIPICSRSKRVSGESWVTLYTTTDTNARRSLSDRVGRRGPR